MTTKVLIPVAKTKRPMGIDTTQTAVGRLPHLAEQDAGGEELKLGQVEYKKVMRLIIKLLHKSGNDPSIGVLDISGHKVRLKLLVSARPGNEVDPDNLSKTREFRIDVLCPTGAHTLIVLRLQQDGNGCFWINVRANPTSAILGYNATGVAINGETRRDERARLLRLPYQLLEALLRTANSKFSWSDATRSRIDKLLFKACPIQLFTYIVPGDFTVSQFLGFLRVLLSCPLGDGKGGFCLLADLLGVQVDVRAPGGPVQTLLLRFPTGDRQAFSACLYDKLAAAQADAVRYQTEIGDASIIQQLEKSVRVDVTLQEPLVRALFAEAKLSSKAALTARNLNRAIGRLNSGKGRSGKSTVVWLLSEIFDKRLHLITLLNFRPSMIDEARKAMKNLGSKAGKVFEEWYAAGFGLRLKDTGRIGFVEFAEKHAKPPVTRQSARTIRAKCLAVGLDLDVPLQAYLAVFNMSHFFNLSDNDREALAVALEAKDTKAVEELLAKARANATAINASVGDTLVRMIKEASVPAVRIGRKRVTKPKPKASKTILSLK